MVYGAAKAGFTDLLSGLRNRLARSGVHVVTVKPGFVRTRMTDGMDLPARLTAGPDGLLRWLSRPLPSAAMWCTCGGGVGALPVLSSAPPETFFQTDESGTSPTLSPFSCLLFFLPTSQQSPLLPPRGGGLGEGADLFKDP